MRKIYYKAHELIYHNGFCKRFFQCREGCEFKSNQGWKLPKKRNRSSLWTTGSYSGLQYTEVFPVLPVPKVAQEYAGNNLTSHEVKNRLQTFSWKERFRQTFAARPLWLFFLVKTVSEIPGHLDILCLMARRYRQILVDLTSVPKHVGCR